MPLSAFRTRKGISGVTRAATDMDCRGGGDFRQSSDHLQERMFERVKSPLSSSSSVSEDGEIDRVAFSTAGTPTEELAAPIGLKCCYRSC